MDKKVIPRNVPPTIGPYSQGIKVIESKIMLFISGQVSVDEKGNTVGKGNIEVQTKQALENVKSMVEAGGGTMGDIVKLGIFITDIENFNKIAKIRYEYFAPPYPASTMVVVKSLVKQDWLIEIEAIAVLPK